MNATKIRNALFKYWGFTAWVAIFIVVLAFGIWGDQILRSRGYIVDFWHCWEIAALGSTIAFNILLYAIGFFFGPRMFVHGNLKDDKCIGLIIPAMACSMIFLGIAVYFAMVAGSFRYQLFFILLGIASFWWLDAIMARESKNTKVCEEFGACVKLNDIPAVAGFAVLYIFSLVYKPQDARTLEMLRPFIGGAIAFQMISSSWAVAVIFRRPGKTPENV